MADNTLETGNTALPKDLVITSQPDGLDRDKFKVVASNLKIDSSYAFQFQYVFADGVTSEWSPGYILTTNTETVPDAPAASVPSTATGSIPVTLSTFPPNAKRVDIYIIGGVFGAGKVADSFFGAGTKNIAVTAGVYQVSLITVNQSGINGDPTNTFTITVSDIVTEDTTAPDPIVSAIPTAGIRPGDSSGQLGYINLAITNGTIPSDFAGYIVKIQGSTNSWTQTFNSSTSLSNLYIGSGILVGQSYSLSVATTDGKNISSYVNSTPSSISVTDNRTNNSTVSGALSFSATDSILIVTWAASTDVNVDSYRVQLTSNTDTNFTSVLKEVYSKSTTASFGDLTPNTTYRIRVTTKYGGSSGQLSTVNTVGTVTLDAYGGISDGQVPQTNPTPTVRSLFKAFAIEWDAITNNDPVTYEIYVKTVNSTGIVNSSNLVMEIDGTFAVITALADGTAIAYPDETSPTTATDYYFAVRAKDRDGVCATTPTAIGPFTASRTGRFDIATDSIYANHIRAGEINADKMTTDLLFTNKTINVGQSASLNRIRLDANTIAAPNATYKITSSDIKSRIFIGAGVYDDTGTSFYADNLGRFSLAQKLKFDGSNLTIDGSGTFTGTVTAGSGANIVKVGNDVNGTNDGIYINATGDYIYTDGTLRLGNGGITYASGVLTVFGNVTANSIAANVSISSPQITGGFYQTSTTVGNGTASSAGIKIDTTGIYGYPASSSTASFSVSNTGIMTANAGTIGGWTINTTQLRSNFVYSSGNSTSGVASYITLNPATPRIELVKNATITNNTATLGSSITIDPIEGITGPTVTVQSNSGPAFKFSPEGTATLRGSVYANSGKIGGWTIDNTQLSSGGVALNSAGSIVISATDSFTQAVQTTTLANGNISLSNNGTSFLSSNSVSVAGRNLAGDVASTTMAPAYFSLSNTYSVGGVSTTSQGIITMNGSILNIYGGSGVLVNIGGGGVLTNLNVDGNFSVLGGLNTSGGTKVITGSSVGTPAIRNIGAGTGAKSGTATDGITGDIWIQYT